MWKLRPREMKVDYTLLWFQNPNSFDEGRDLIHFLISFLLSFIYLLFFFSIFLAVVLSVGFWLLDKGSNLCPLWWKHGVLMTGPPGKSFDSFSNLSHRAEHISSLIEILNKWQQINVSLKTLYISNDIFHLYFLKNNFCNWLRCVETHAQTHNCIHSKKESYPDSKMSKFKAH